MTHLKPIDAHIHGRGSEYDTDYLRLAMEDALAVGLCHVIEMPNPKPWLTTRELCDERHERWIKLQKALEREYSDITAHGHTVNERIGHGVHVGLTTDFEQVKAALSWCRSDKVFYSHSTGNLGLLDPDRQKAIWRHKGEIGYAGVSIGHFEDESKFGSCGVQFDPADPVSHSLYQKEDAEVSQVQQQLVNAARYDFAGTFYIAHVSSPETVALVKRWRKSGRPRFDIVLEMTWHHMLLNFEQDYAFFGDNCLKCNPPIRSRRTQEALLDHVLRGDIDIIATDHAPHPPERKKDPKNPASGIPGLPFWPEGILQLAYKYQCSRQLLDQMIFHNANRIFKLGLKPTEMTNVPYDTKRWKKYGFNPFIRLGQ